MPESQILARANTNTHDFALACSLAARINLMLVWSVRTGVDTVKESVGNRFSGGRGR